MRLARIVKVNQYTIQGEFIKTWNSLSDAMRHFKANSTGNIASCCKGKRPSAHGYIWRYIGDSFDKYPYMARGIILILN